MFQLGYAKQNYAIFLGWNLHEFTNTSTDTGETIADTIARSID